MKSKIPTRTWGIKLGSAGICVPFCESHKIIGLGWKSVDPGIVHNGSYEKLSDHISQLPNLCHGDKRRISSDTGQLYRFARECQVGDYVLYYDPPSKHVRICKVTSGPLYREFELSQSNVDIWHYRKVEYPMGPIKIFDFDGRLKGGVLGPRMSFWQIREGTEAVEDIITGNKAGTSDPKIKDAYSKLKEQIISRARMLSAEDWEIVVADYLRAQGAHIFGKVGGNRPIVDVEARFDRGELGEEIWLGQVKHYRDQKIDWPEIESIFNRVSDDKSIRFFFVSSNGFTEKAIGRAYDEGIRLFEAGDFTRFFLSGKLNDRLRSKLGLIDLEAGKRGKSK